MDTFNKFQVKVSFVKNKRPIEVYCDLFTKANFENVTRIVTAQLRKVLKFPCDIEVFQLAEDEFLFQACSSVYQVMPSICADISNILYNYGN